MTDTEARSADPRRAATGQDAQGQGAQGQPAEIENLLLEERTFPPSAAFAAQANAKPGIYEEAERDPVAFWERIARDTVTWREPFTKTLEWDLPFAKWFLGGKVNVSE